MNIERLFGQRSFVLSPYQESDEALESFAYPGALCNHYVVGSSIRVDSSVRPPWVGHFLGGRLSPNSASICCDHPDGRHVVVVARGAAYMVSSTEPQSWAELPILPVMGFCASKSAKALALYDYSRMLVLTLDGSWTTKTISWDGLQDVREDGNSIFGRGWDAVTNTFLPFKIDLVMRSTEGGASPPAK